jgi:hypothetical protein
MQWGLRAGMKSYLFCSNLKVILLSLWIVVLEVCILEIINGSTEFYFYPCALWLLIKDLYPCYCMFILKENKCIQDSENAYESAQQAFDIKFCNWKYLLYKLVSKYFATLGLRSK